MGRSSPKILSVPPKIRALARVVYDQLPTSNSDDAYELRLDTSASVVKELVGNTLSQCERVQLEQMLTYYGQRLRLPPTELLRGSRVGFIVELTATIDAQMRFTDISLVDQLGALVETHNYFTSILTTEVPARQEVVFSTFVRVIERVLVEILKYVKMEAELQPNEVPHRELLADLNGMLWSYIDHFKWFVPQATEFFFHFDANDHVHDISAREVWNTYVGRNLAACTRQEFEPAMDMFPQWTREVIVKVLDHADCGVVSVYSLNRLLAVWGPFLLLDRNMRNDISLGMFDLTSSAEATALRFRATANPGDYVVLLSRKHGVLNVVVMTPARDVKTLLLDHATGAWNLANHSHEDYESVCDVCTSMSHLLKAPKGTVKTSQSASDQQTLNEFVSDASSILHRACFRNNVQYVKKLLHRGSTVLVNIGVADASISASYVWTPLLCAVNNPNGDPHLIVDSLLEVGANASFRDNSGATALYYAIANSYPIAVRRLLAVDPRMPPSSTSHVLFVALGAHYYNVSDLDNRRLMDTIPSADVVREVLPYIDDWDLVKQAISIVNGKLLGVDVRPASRDELHYAKDLNLPLLTHEDQEENTRCIARHSRMCRTFKRETQAVLHEMQMRSFLLSCRHFISQL
jgi:hypothetical protein